MSKKGMSGLSYAGIIAQKLLTERLELHDYTHSDKTHEGYGLTSGNQYHSQYLWMILELSMFGKNMRTT